MSAAIFADTLYFLALLNTAETAHARAVKASCVADLKFVTTEFVLVELADALSRPQDVGDGIRVASVFDPFGNTFGIIQNPNFKLPEA